MPIPAKVASHLKKKNIKHDIIEHRVVYTAYDLAQTLREDLKCIAKTLLIRTDDGFILAVVPADMHLDLKGIQKAADTKKAKIAQENDMRKHLKIKPGAITPFGSMYSVSVIFDKKLSNSPNILVGAGTFTESLKLKPKDVVASEEATVAPISKKPSKPYKLQVKKSTPKKKTTRKPKKRSTAKKK